MADHQTDGYRAAKQQALDERRRMHEQGGGQAVAARYADAIEEAFHGWFAAEAVRGTSPGDLTAGMCWAMGYNLASIALGLGCGDRRDTQAAADAIGAGLSESFKIAVAKHLQGRGLGVRQQVEAGGLTDIAVTLPGRGRDN